MDEDSRRLLEDARRDLAAATDGISEAVSAMEGDGGVAVEDLLSGALSRLKILSSRIDRHLEGR